jgi:hypothetical protein
MPLTHFLLIYDHDKQKLIDALDLGTSGEAAGRTYAEYEQKHRDDKGIEIVLVGADSLDTIRRTHGHYFSESASDPFPELVADA